MSDIRYAGKSALIDDKPPDLYAEYDDEETIAAVASALETRYQVSRIEGDEAAYLHLRKARPDLVFNISEGFCGPNREAHIPIICEMLRLPCTGSDALTLGICLDKARTKEILTYHGIPTARFIIAGLNSHSALKQLKMFPLPAIVKPLREGSSMGIYNDSLASNRDQLLQLVTKTAKAYDQPVLVEEFLPGREFTSGIFGNAPDYEVLPIVEINHSALPPGANPIYGYEAKWLWDDPANPLPILSCPAKIPAALEKKLRRYMQQAATVLCIKDWCRIDLRLDRKGEPKILELNPLPGILPDPRENSALPAAAKAAGYTYNDLILKVAETALRRYGLC